MLYKPIPRCALTLAKSLSERASGLLPEECDNGANLSALSVDPGSAFSVFKDSQL